MSKIARYIHVFVFSSMASEFGSSETTHPRFHLPLSPRTIPRDRLIKPPKHSRSRWQFGLPLRRIRFGTTVDGDFFQQLIALQNENATLKRQSTELEALLQRRQESYIRRETKLQYQIQDLEAKNQFFWNQHTSSDTTDEEYFQLASSKYTWDNSCDSSALQSELEDGLEALLLKQKLQLGVAQIAQLEDIDEKLKKMECEFHRKTDRLSDLDTDRKLQNERAVIT